MRSVPEPDDPRRCTGTNRAGTRCKRWAIPGGNVCTKHGGGAPQVRRAAMRRLQREQLTGDLGAILADLEVDASGTHPVEVLLDAVRRCHAMVQVIGALVGGLATGRPTDDDGAPEPLWGPNHLGDGAPHILTEMYATWIDRAARASKLACDAGVEERLVRLAEDQARLMAEVLRAFATELGHDPAEEGVRTAMRRSLTVVSGAGAA